MSLDLSLQALYAASEHLDATRNTLYSLKLAVTDHDIYAKYQICNTHLLAFDEACSNMHDLDFQPFRKRSAYYHAQLEKIKNTAQAKFEHEIRARVLPCLDELTKLRERLEDGPYSLALDKEIQTVTQLFRSAVRQESFFPKSSSMECFLEEARMQFDAMCDLLSKKRNEMAAFSAEDSPLLTFYREFQAALVPDTPRACLLQAFESLGVQDRRLFVEEFFSLSFTSKDMDNFLKAKYATLFKHLDTLPDSARGAAESALLSSLPRETLTEEEKDTWVVENLLTQPFLPDVMKNVLLKKVESFEYKSFRQTALARELERIAQEDGVRIVGMGAGEWAEVHLQDDMEGSLWMDRLVRGLSAIDRNMRQKRMHQLQEELSAKYGETITEQLFTLCPLLQSLKKGQENHAGNLDDLRFRAAALSQLQTFRFTFSSKHPQLRHLLQDPSHPLFKLWEAQEFAILLAPPYDFDKRQLFVDQLFQRLHLLSLEDLRPEDIEVYLELILKQASIQPRQSEIQGETELRWIRQTGIAHVAESKFDIFSGKGACFKDIFLIRNPDGEILGKYKPNHATTARREKACYESDSVLGFDVTSPTGYASLSYPTVLRLIQDKLQQADAHFRKASLFLEAGELTLAQREEEWGTDKQSEAISLSSHLPSDLLSGLYACLETRLSRGGGEELWNNTSDPSFSNAERILSIEDYLSSKEFHAFIKSNAFARKDDQGSIQRWISVKGERAYDLLHHSGTAEIFTGIPKSLVHSYCVLGIIKGSRDCSSGNTMLSFSPEGNVRRFHDYDDEASMPLRNDYRDVRMWQFGLPQADVPFDRTFLQMFSDEMFLKTFGEYNAIRDPHIPQAAYEAQKERVKMMADLFQQELGKNDITLTPRDLFFHLFGGKEVYERLQTEGFKNPWEIFEFGLGSIGLRGSHQSVAAQVNFQALFGVNRREMAFSEEIRIAHPHAKVIVQYQPSSERALFIRGSHAGLSWDKGLPLTRIRENLWIWEQGDEDAVDDVSVEYKILLDDDEWSQGSNFLLNSRRIAVPTFS
jgi:hypothetical protein